MISAKNEYHLLKLHKEHYSLRKFHWNRVAPVDFRKDPNNFIFINLLHMLLKKLKSIFCDNHKFVYFNIIVKLLYLII